MVAFLGHTDATETTKIKCALKWTRLVLGFLCVTLGALICVTKNACSVKVSVCYIATMVLFDEGHYRNDSNNLDHPNTLLFQEKLLIIVFQAFEHPR